MRSCGAQFPKKHDAGQAIGNVLQPVLMGQISNMELPNPHDLKWRGFGFHGHIFLSVQFS